MPTDILLDGLATLACARLDCAQLAERVLGLETAREWMEETLSDPRILAPHHAAISGGSNPYALESWTKELLRVASSFEDSSLRERALEYVLEGLEPQAFLAAFQVALQISDSGFASSLLRCLRHSFTVLPRL